MSDLGSVAKREMERVTYVPFTFESFLLERERRLARQRWTAGLVAVGILAVLVVVGLSIARSRDGSEPTPGRPPVHGAGPLTLATRTGLFMQSPDGRRVRLTGAAVTAFAWSPDGSKLAYLGGDVGVDCVLWVEDVASQHQTRIADCHSYGGHDVAWSPDGSRLLFVGDQGLETIGVDGSDPTQVSDGPRLGTTDLSWSPDGTRISFADGQHLYVTALDPWNPIPVASGISYAWAPDWSRLAYSRDDATKNSTPGGDPFVLQVFSAQPDGSHPRLVTEQDGCCMTARLGLTWSPDGSRIAVMGRELEIVDVTTGHDHVIADLNGNRNLLDVPPAWRPVPTT